jgi:hypothetical protein
VALRLSSARPSVRYRCTIRSGHPIPSSTTIGRGNRPDLLEDPVKEAALRGKSVRTTFAGRRSCFQGPFGNNLTLEPMWPINNPVKNLQKAVVTPRTRVQTDYGIAIRTRRGGCKGRHSGNISTAYLVYQQQNLPGAERSRVGAINSGWEGEALL